MIDYRKELSGAQYDAVTYLGGPELVIAGAGSGKTRVLTYKIAYLLEKGIRPNNILALTFTNKAAKEMKNRITALTSKEQVKGLIIGTFHSIFAKILRFEARGGGLPYTEKFTIYDTDDQKRLVKDIIKELGVDEKKYDSKHVVSRISAAKNDRLTPDQYVFSELYLEDKVADLPKVLEIFKRYNIRLRQSNAMDFDDLLLNTYMLFKENEKIRRKYANNFRYCLIDEYQDTNTVQQDIFEQLTRDRNMWCVVGDDAQSIYAFRGAKIENILGLKEKYFSLKTVKLEENYRSTKTIVRAANSVIKHNLYQIPKELFSNNSEGRAIKFCCLANEMSEAAYVVNVIKGMVCYDHRSLDDFAILYRSNFLSRALERAFLREHVPYKIYAGLSFFQRKEIKDVLAYLRLIVNPADEQSFQRIINYPSRKIGDASIVKLKQLAEAYHKSLYDVLLLSNVILKVFPRNTANSMLEFHRMMERLKVTSNTSDVLSLFRMVIEETGIIKVLMDSKDPDDSERVGNINELQSDIRSFVEESAKEGGGSVILEDYLNNVSLLSSDEEPNDSEAGEKVRLMTVHGSKGLEFPVVFLVGLDNNIFPSSKVIDCPKAFEEERRLFYVALTRAKDECFLSSVKQRYLFGKNQSYSPSDFINEIDSSCIR